MQPLNAFCDLAEFPSLPFVGKVKESAPLPTYETRVEGGNVEVNV
jgi:hypothetical protein